jgi:polysaccharide export outer membrane protein
MRLLASIAAATLTLGCLHDTGRYVAVDDYQEPGNEAEYVIKTGDMLFVRVFQQDNMSARSRVRADGRISLPFLNDVVAAGFTPQVLASQLQTRLKDFLSNPVVTVSLEEVRQLSVPVLGEVARPGNYPLEHGAGVLQALASAGGFTPYARKDVYVVRPSGKPKEAQLRLRFDWAALFKAEGKGPLFNLRPGDVVLVE